MNGDGNTEHDEVVAEFIEVVTLAEDSVEDNHAGEDNIEDNHAVIVDNHSIEDNHAAVVDNHSIEDNHAAEDNHAETDRDEEEEVRYCEDGGMPSSI